jgi:hypothetical protein
MESDAFMFTFAVILAYLFPVGVIVALIRAGRHRGEERADNDSAQ